MAVARHDREEAGLGKPGGEVLGQLLDRVRLQHPGREPDVEHDDG